MAEGVTCEGARVAAVGSAELWMGDRREREGRDEGVAWKEQESSEIGTT